MDINRISLASVGTVAHEEPIYLQIGEATIELRREIPYEEVLDMMQWCIDYVVNDRPFLSAPLRKIVEDMAVLKFYTNLDVDTIMASIEMTDIYAAYDVIKTFNIMEEVLPKINSTQYRFFLETMHETVDSIIAYRNSAKGIIDALATDAKKDTEAMEGAMGLIQDDERAARLGKLLQFAEEISQNKVPNTPQRVTGEPPEQFIPVE